MAKIKTYNGKYDNVDFFCPGCNKMHILSDKVHTWNKDVDKPTFTPSVLFVNNPRCHSFITDGNIQYLNDCQHELAGQTIALPNID